MSKSSTIACASGAEHDPLPAIPNDITITQLLLDGKHAMGIRPKRPDGVPWLIDDATGREIGLEEVWLVSVISMGLA